MGASVGSAVRFAAGFAVGAAVGPAVGAQERLWAEPHAGPMPPIIENEKRNLGPPLIANSSIYFV